jgi:DNA replication and repair protein RecF
VPPTAWNRLSRLSLSGFRNLTDQQLEFPPEGVALVGRNAQGKTNLLEAIYYLETFRSFRGTRDERLIRFGEDLFRIEAKLSSGAAEPDGEGRTLRGHHADRHILAAFQASPREKRVTVDGQATRGLAEAVGGVGAVIFSPEDVRLVSDGPELRRRFLDVVLSLNREGYLAALQRFRQALAQRNAALRAGGSLAGPQAWDEILVRSGSVVAHGRLSWVRENQERFAEYVAELSGSGPARIVYEPGIPGVAPPDEVQGEEVDAVRRAYIQGLTDSSARERRLGSTQVGPHRDELRFRVGSEPSPTDLREFGSGGQRRTVALALRLLEVDAVRTRRSREPILLLDDVFAELDENRSRRVLGLLDRLVPGQVILTAPKEGDVRFRDATLARGRVEGGEVRL